MKALIWFLTIVIVVFLNTLLGAVAGWRVGYLVIYLLIGFVAKKLCNAWDNRSKKKQSGETELSPETENNLAELASQSCFEREADMPSLPETTEAEQTAMAEQKELPKVRFCRKCGFQLLDGSDFCSQCGVPIVKEECI